MQANQDNWESYRERELSRLSPVLKGLGYALEAEQPHIRGERALTGSGARKLVLLGTDNTGRRAVIKASSERAGKEEMARERRSREVLERIGFAYQTFLSPKELFWGSRGGMAVLITEFIEQDRPFLERPVEEQFAFALAAFKAQESAHATTSSHLSFVRNFFGEMGGEGYVRQASAYARDIAGEAPQGPVARAVALLKDHRHTLDQYGGFLTHWDFTPQNFRIRNGEMYLLDHYSIRFGNKYEGWARFINFMELYNPPLARALLRYVRDNRTPEESLSLKLMRLYRLLELIRYYVLWLPKTEGNLNDLARARIAFWSGALSCVLEDKEVPPESVSAYIRTRDRLRSEDEKRRQVGLH